MIQKVCEVCKKEFFVYNSDVKKRPCKYCSMSCARKVTNTLRKGKELSLKRKEQLERLHNQTRIKNPMKGVHRYDEKSPSWKGGKTLIYRTIRNSQAYMEWRYCVLRRDEFKCQFCGDKSIIVHHIHPLKLIVLENNIKSMKDALNCSQLWLIHNGLTLCKLCHYKIHVGDFNGKNISI